MKKFLYISLVLLAVFASSCTKENIQPISEAAGTPMWKSSRAGGVATPTPTTPIDASGSGITDPNNDEDGSKRKKQH